MMRRPRLHWFWRAAIAVLAGVVYGAFARYHFQMCKMIHDALAGLPIDLRTTMAHVFGEKLWPCVISVASYGLLTRYAGSLPRDRETRCRECGYILRGITEPRCPECGERV